MRAWRIVGIAIAFFVFTRGVWAEMDQSLTDLQKYEKATFAGGCFWCLEPPFDKLPGVKATIPGYTGGQKENPTYAEVSSGATGHAEAVEIYYDPVQITYEQLLDVFWKNIDPTTLNRQFSD